MEPTTSTTISRLHKADLHLLAVFMSVAECGGFAAAQVALNVSQSTISRQIGDLEKRLGMRLCQRGRAGFRLTDKGRTVYEACQLLSTALASFRTTVGALRGELEGDLSIAAIDDWATERGFPMADVLRAFRTKASNVHIHFHTLAPDEIERAVLENRVNLGIGVFHQHRPGLSYEALYDDPVELYCGRGHPLFDRAPHGLEPLHRAQRFGPLDELAVAWGVEGNGAGRFGAALDLLGEPVEGAARLGPKGVVESCRRVTERLRAVGHRREVRPAGALGREHRADLRERFDSVVPPRAVQGVRGVVRSVGVIGVAEGPPRGDERGGFFRVPLDAFATRRLPLVRRAPFVEELVLRSGA